MSRRDGGVLVPDFNGSIPALDTVCAARPDVFNHNIETVPRQYAKIRPIAEYRRSLGVLSYAAGKGFKVKSGLMLGLGETKSESQKNPYGLKICRLHVAYLRAVSGTVQRSCAGDALCPAGRI